MNVLAIGCHPDDVECGCSGTLAKCVKRGDKVIVCHASTGNLGHVVIPPEELIKIRANEAKKAGALAGIEASTTLTFTIIIRQPVTKLLTLFVMPIPTL